MFAGINVAVVDLAVVVSLYLLVLEVVVWCGVVRCNYDIVVVLMVVFMVEWYWMWCMCHVILNPMKISLKKEFCLFFYQTEYACVAWATTTIDRLIL